MIVDGYTEDTNLNAYYANRETLGTAALKLNPIGDRQHNCPPSTTPRYTPVDTTDTNEIDNSAL